MKKQLNIVCFFWQGSDRPGWLDVNLGIEYIWKLYKGFQRNTTIPFNFHCLTTLKKPPQETGIIFHKLDSPSWRGCLPKYSVFNKQLGLQGRVFACDLDVVITGNMDEILSYAGPFATRSTFRPPFESGGDMVAFEAGTYSWIWDDLVTNPSKVINFTQGRERWVYRYHSRFKDGIDFLQQLYPNQIYSYKNHIRGRSLPENARIVSCHGNPRPHQIKEDWVKRYWKF